ncbi:DUF418 domain-containing protein [Dysgonomonas sp. 216]|uniref:acyltransferase family protein n=1 Tax=Dysgonomonas sp. 216 TaxID=2302934 RepID=UPI0013D4855F|nr:DUF418 domain-containing protein [Dysgonomonas sp. 216]NDW18701.1 DUF418 domain-containing protein [Dysgonomonas sp. 216]
MGTQRNIYIDYIKAVVIILVVLGHSIQCFDYGVTSLLWSDWLFKLIYTFHMPLLLAISGYYSYFSIKKQSLYIYTKKRVQYIFVPMVVWCVLYSIIVQVCFAQTFDVISFVKVLAENIQYGYWFIWAILFSAIYSAVLHKLRLDNVIGFLVSSILLMFIDIHNFQFPIVISFFPFFAIGYLLAKVDINKLISFCKKYFLLFLIASLICYFLWTDKAYVYITPSNFENWSTVLFRDITAIVISVSFLIIFYYIYRYISRSKVVSFLSEVGKETLPIYLSHHLIVNLFQAGYLYFNVFETKYSIIFIIPSLLFVVLFYYFTRIINKNKIAAYLLLGKKL